MKEMIQTMVRAKYDSDPVKAWKEAQKKIMVCVVVVGIKESIFTEHSLFELSVTVFSCSVFLSY